MLISDKESELYIKMLYEYEEAHDIPEDERLTFDIYAVCPEIPDVSPQKKEYVEIDTIIQLVNDLIYQGKL